MTAPGRESAPYWADYLCRERTFCSVCPGHATRIGPPIPRDVNRPGRKAAWKTAQQAAFRRHVAEAHPGLRVRWAR